VEKRKKNPKINFKSAAFYFLLCLVLLVLAILFTWPLIEKFNLAIVSQSDFTDGPFFLWNLWWVKKSILSGQNPLWTNYVYYPANVNLTLHTLTLTSGLVYILLSKFFSLVTSLNLIQIGSIIASGVGIFLLAVYLAKPATYLEKTALVVSAIIFALCPFVFSHMLAGHYNLTMLWPIPFVILFLYKVLREDKIINAFSLALFAILLGYLDLQLLFFTALIIFAVMITEATFNFKSFFSRGRWLYLSIAFGIFLLVFLIPYSLATMKFWNLRFDFNTFNNADFSILFGKNPLNPIFGTSGLKGVVKLIGSYRENIISLGFVSLFFSLCGLVFFPRVTWREKIALLLSFLFGAAFFLGPFFQTNGHIFYNIRLPFYFLQKLPLLNIGIVPTRFIVVAYFSLAALAGLGLMSIVRFLAKKKLVFLGYIIIFISVLSLLVETYSGPMLLDFLPQHPYLDSLSKEAGDFTVLPYNPSPRDGFLEAEHGHSVVTGFLGRRIHDPYQAQYGGVYPISKFIRNEADLLNLDDDPVTIKAIFAKYKIRYIIVDKMLQDEKKLNDLKNYLLKMGISLSYEDYSIVAYKLN